MWRNTNIYGGTDFINHIVLALTLLDKHSHDASQLIYNNVGIIEEGFPSGVEVASKPARILYHLNDYDRRSSKWLALQLVHEAYHVQLYKNEKNIRWFPSPDAWTGQKAEQACIGYQIAIARMINADKHEIDYLMSLDGTHSDLDDDGEYTWKDYHKRSW